MSFPGGSDGKESACNEGDLSSIPGWEDPLGKEMATHSSILAWGIPWTEEPGGLPSIGSQRVGHDWATKYSKHLFQSVQWLSHVWLFAIPWPAARQASLSITSSPSLLKLMFIELVMPPNHLILCRPLLLLPSIFPSIRVFSKESVLHVRWPKYGVSASASVLPMNIQDRFPLRFTGWISLQSKGLLRVFSKKKERKKRVFSNTTVQKHKFFGAQLSL